MIKFMTSVLFVLFVCTAAEAQQNARSGKWDRVTDPYNHEYVDAATAAIREVMEENFRACTTEDLKAVMTTMTSNCPDRTSAGASRWHSVRPSSTRRSGRCVAS
jgi:hypothetical protein